MKRLLIVLFGVFALQGNALAQACYEDYTKDGGAGPATAGVLTPTSDDSSILNKGAAFLLQWRDREEILGGKVKVTLRRAKGDKIVPLGDAYLNRLPNTGYALISKRSLNGAKIKTGEENKHYFQIEKVGVAAAVIKSGCFTFHPKPERPDKNCQGAQKMHECVKALEVTVADVQEQLTALKEGGTQDGQSGGATVINQDTAHNHDDRYATKHSHNFASSSHSHDNYAERDSEQSQSAESLISLIQTSPQLRSQLQGLVDGGEPVLKDGRCNYGAPWTKGKHGCPACWNFEHGLGWVVGIPWGGTRFEQCNKVSGIECTERLKRFFDYLLPEQVDKPEFEQIFPHAYTAMQTGVAAARMDLKIWMHSLADEAGVSFSQAATRLYSEESVSDNDEGYPSFKTHCPSESAVTPHEISFNKKHSPRAVPLVKEDLVCNLDKGDALYKQCVLKKEKEKKEGTYSANNSVCWQSDLYGSTGGWVKGETAPCCSEKAEIGSHNSSARVYAANGINLPTHDWSAWAKGANVCVRDKNQCQEWATTMALDTNTGKTEPHPICKKRLGSGDNRLWETLMNPTAKN